MVKDIITGDEIISDSYDMTEVDDAVYEVDCAMITVGAVEVSTCFLRSDSGVQDSNKGL